MLRSIFVNKIKRQLGQGGIEFCKYCGFNYTIEWCMAFVSYAMREVAELKNNFPVHVSCTEFSNSPFSLCRRNKEFETAEIGDIIIFELDYNDRDMEHVGIVIDVTKDGIVLIEGNTDGKNKDETTVNTFSYSKHNPKFYWIIDMSEFFVDSYDKEEKYSQEMQVKSEELIELLESISNSIDDVKNDINYIQKHHDEVIKLIHELM